jgi:hypothetical protein
MKLRIKRCIFCGKYFIRKSYADKLDVCKKCHNDLWVGSAEKEVEKMYILEFEIIKEKIRDEYDGTVREKLYLKLGNKNKFEIFAKCTECCYSACGKGIVKLPMETYGSENKRSVEVRISIPDWSG